MLRNVVVWTVLIGTLVGISSSPIQALEETEVGSTGFKTDKVYEAGEIDTVSLFNGNLTVTIPIGNSYPVHALSYNLTLINNSNTWLFDERYDQPLDETFITAEPHPYSNAGLGWMLTLGDLYAPDTDMYNDKNNWLYVGPDGSLHEFYDDLHHQASGDEDGSETVLYTRDSTYLRMQPVGGDREIEFPDGSVHKFDESAQGSGIWELIEIRDRFGNSLSVTRTASAWTLTDSVGRVHLIEFEDGAGGTPRVDRVVLEAFGGNPATYEFTYLDTEIDRGCGDTDPVTQDRLTVSLLTEVVLPGNNGLFKMIDPQTSGARYSTQCGGLVGNSGSIVGIQLPTLGQIEWEYGTWHFPKLGDQPGPVNGTPIWQARQGVIKRRLLDRNSNEWGGVGAGTWEYSNELFPPSSEWVTFPVLDIETVPRETRTYVKYPTGDCTTHYFAANPGYGLVNRPFPGWEYGLPFSYETVDPVESLYLSTEVWTDSAPFSGNVYDAEFRCSDEKLRSSYVLYEHDAVGATRNLSQNAPPDGWLVTDWNRRVQKSRTVFHDDADRYIFTVSSDFDGLGHYRTVTQESDFRPNPSDQRTTKTEYNSSLGAYAVDQMNNNPLETFTMFSISDPWLINRYSYQQTEIADTAAPETLSRTRFSFNTSNGVLRCVRSSPSGIALTSADTLVVYDEDSFGNRTQEDWYGGDLQTLPTQGTCTRPTPDEHVYQIDHRYSGAAGVRKTSKYFDDANNVEMPYFLYDVTPDASTGLPKSSRGTDLISTTYTYDTLGRLLTSIPASGEGARTDYVYTKATGQNFAKLRIDRTGDSGPILSRQDTLYDDFGRLYSEQRLQPEGVTVSREHFYNARGWKTRVTEWDDVGVDPLSKDATQFLTFDPFGRPGTIRPADGSSHDVLLTYFGNRVVERSVAIEQVGGETRASTFEYYDGHGRLWRVRDPSFPNGDLLSTNYYYDVGDRLYRVRFDSLEPQDRYFTYDNRGFLLSESHPEKGGNGTNGVVTYSGYDAMGKVGTRVDGPSTVRHTYDAAGRVTRLIDNNKGRNLKKFVYDTPVARHLGKVREATRWNYVDFPGGNTNETTVKVKEVYTYSGVGGRISKRLTTLSSLGYEFRQDFTYDPLGNIDTLTYPRCRHATCTSTGAGPVVDHNYFRGFLTEIDSWASDITYHTNGMIENIQHTNGLRDFHTIDPRQMRRPRRIQVRDTPADAPLANVWDSGAYSYDGAGNIKSMGSDTFAYDGAQRLVEATVAGYLQEYTYDRYGNLRSYDTTEPGGSPVLTDIPTFSKSNRLQNATYDSAGNITSNAGLTFDIDPLHHMRYINYDAPAFSADFIYLYTADEERILQYKTNESNPNPKKETITIRDLSGRVLSQFKLNGEDEVGNWSREREYIWGPSGLLASKKSSDILHHHNDHLGTPRYVSDSVGAKVYENDYLPFGGEIEDGDATDPVKLKFTGHERDTIQGGDQDDLDYMHARYYSPRLGKFWSMDPVLKLREAMKMPQRWNRFTYVANNPMKWVDRTGEFIVLPSQCKDGDCEELDVLEQLFADAGVETELTVGDDGKVESVGSELEGSDNLTVELLAGLINDQKNGVDFAFTSLPLTDRAGATTKKLKGTDVLQIRINPQTVRQNIFKGVALSGPFEGATVGGTGTPGPALVHELGHAAAFFSGFPFNEMPYRGRSNDEALRYENFHRSMLSGPENFRRLFHDQPRP